MTQQNHTDDRTDLEELCGLNQNKRCSLRDSGFETISEVAESTVDELAEIDGIGVALAYRVQAAAQDITEGDSR